MADWEATLKSALAGFAQWRFTSAAQRSEILMLAAERLRANRDSYVDLLVTEAHKPLTLARVETDRAVQTLTWSAQEALRFAGKGARIDTIAGARTGIGIIQRFPRGVILGITPFNFPLNLALHKIGPALATGNAIVIKPSPFTPRISRALLDLFAGSLPNGALQVTLPNDAEMPALVADPRWAMISFTGSDRVGRIIQKQNPYVPHCLELGGNAFCMVAEDVRPEDYEAIIRRVVGSAFGFAGQSCISSQNLAVHRRHWDAFLPLLRAQVEKVPFGDPARAETVCGPVIDDKAYARLQSAIAGRVTAQSTHLIGSAPANLFPPTLITLPKWEASPLTQTEIFGPVLIAYPFEQLPDFIAQVESSPYGLQTGVFTQHLPTIETLFSRLSVGGVIINDSPSARLEHQPYGGVKNSGEGREGVRHAMQEMTVTKFLSLSSQIP